MYRFKLKEVCERKGMTFTELARRTGIPQPSLSRYNSHNRSITLRQLGRIALVLDAGIDDLVSESSVCVEFRSEIEAIEERAVKQDKSWVTSAHENLQQFRSAAGDATLE